VILWIFNHDVLAALSVMKWSHYISQHTSFLTDINRFRTQTTVPNTAVIITGTRLVKFCATFLFFTIQISVFKLFVFTVVKNLALNKGTCGPDLP